MEFPKVDSLGQTIVLSGLQQYIRANVARQNLGLTALAAPDPAAVFSTAIFSAAADASAHTMTITYTPPSAGQVFVLRAGPPVSAGRAYWSDFRLIASQDSGDTSPLAAGGGYEGVWGPLLAGARVFLRASVLNECGVYGPAYDLSIIVAA